MRDDQENNSQSVGEQQTKTNERRRNSLCNDSRSGILLLRVVVLLQLLPVRCENASCFPSALSCYLIPYLSFLACLLAYPVRS